MDIYSIHSIYLGYVAVSNHSIGQDLSFLMKIQERLLKLCSGRFPHQLSLCTVREKKTRQRHHKQQLSIVEEKLRQNQYRQHDKTKIIISWIQNNHPKMFWTITKKTLEKGFLSFTGDVIIVIMMESRVQYFSSITEY